VTYFFFAVQEKLGKLAEAAALKDEEIKKMKQANEKDQAEVKKLRVEAVKLKMLLQSMLNIVIHYRSYLLTTI